MGEDIFYNVLKNFFVYYDGQIMHEIIAEMSLYMSKYL